MPVFLHPDSLARLLAFASLAAWLCGCGFCSEMRVRADNDWSAESTRLEDEMLVELNNRRGQGASCGGQRFEPAPPLAPRAELRRAARHHSLDMVQRGYFDHCSLEGCDAGHRIEASGWPAGSIWAENIATGAAAIADAASAVQQLMASPEHCQAIMDARHRYVGIGYATSSPDSEHYWTQVFVE